MPTETTSAFGPSIGWAREPVRARGRGRDEHERGDEAGRSDGVARRLQVEGLRRAPTGETTLKVHGGTLRAGEDAFFARLLAERLDLARAARCVPAELLAHHAPRRARSRRAGRQQAARRGQPEPRAAQQHVADRAGLLAAGGVDDLGQQVGAAGDDRLGQLGGRASASTSCATWP